jgi:hypothetical protein
MSAFTLNRCLTPVKKYLEPFSRQIGANTFYHSKITTMKKLLIAGLAVMLLLTSPAVFGRHNYSIGKKEIRRERRIMERNEVNFLTKEKFGNDFPAASDAVYSKDKKFDEVSFDMDGQHFIAFYDDEANLVGTTTSKQINDLPLYAQKFISKKYLSKGYTTEKVILFDDNEASPADAYIYGQQFADEDMYFVELKNADKAIVLRVRMDGVVSFFTKL